MRSNSDLAVSKAHHLGPSVLQTSPWGLLHNVQCWKSRPPRRLSHLISSECLVFFRVVVFYFGIPKDWQNNDRPTRLEEANWNSCHMMFRFCAWRDWLLVNKSCIKLYSALMLPNMGLWEKQVATPKIIASNQIYLTSISNAHFAANQ